MRVNQACTALVLMFILWAAATASNQQEADIVWDARGVPHIYAESKEALLYAWGWAQMRAHGNVILEQFGSVRGNAAELWGEAYLKVDRHLWRLGIPPLLESLREEMSTDPQGEAFIAGMNAYAEAYPEALDERLKEVLPLTSNDLLAAALSAQGLLLGRDQLEHIREQYERDGQVDARPRLAPAAASNAWVLGPQRSASGNPILLSNTHLPWPTLGAHAPSGASAVEGLIWFEAHLVTPELNVYGVGPVGSPAVVLGFNDYLGWTVTIPAGFETFDLYELRLQGGGYLFDGEVRDFELISHTLNVLQDDGSYRQEESIFKRSLHGPVIAQRDGGALALRTEPISAEGVLADQHWEMAQARTLDEFKAAIEAQALGALNLFYADRDGNIMYTLNGFLPERPSGLEGYTLIPGERSEILWDSGVPVEAMPRLTNPESGFLQNANEPFYTVSLPPPFDPADFPADWPGPQLWPRAQRSLQLVTSQEQFTRREVMEIAFDTSSLLAEGVLEPLLEAALAQGSAQAQAAAEVLAGWDGRFDADRVGAVLFAFWAMQYEPNILGGAVFPQDAFAAPLRLDDPLHVPHGLADLERAVDALEVAAETVEQAFGTLEVPWGAFVNFKLGETSFPAFGAPPEGFGVMNATLAAPTNEGPLEAVFGDTWIAAIEFGDTVEAYAVMSYGNTTDPDSPFFGGQLEQYAAKSYQPIVRTREDVEAGAALIETLSW